MTTCAEEDLLRGVRDGDPAALEKLYAATRDRLFTTLRRLGADPATAEDLTHEVYLRLWTRRRRLPDVPSPLAYLATAARNLWKNHCDHRGFLRRLLDRAGRRARPRPTHPVLDAQDLDRALATLDHEPREVFVLHRFAGLPYRDIADTLQVSVKTVEARMKRAFDHLRIELRERLSP